MNVYTGLSEADFQQLCRYSLVLYNGMHLVYINGNAEEPGYFDAWDLAQQKRTLIEKNPAILKPVDRHLGMVNTRYGAVYAARRSLRAFSVGLTSENLKTYCVNDDTARAALLAFKSINILKAYNNDYPSLDDAYQTAIAEGTSRAFDKSFAVDAGGHIYYRYMSKIGTVTKDKAIKFKNGYEHLLFRIGDSNGKNYQPV